MVRLAWGLGLIAWLAANVADAQTNKPAASEWRKDAVAALARGSSWLAKQQSAADGGWHSQTYGSLKDGAAVTSLSLYALSQLRTELRSKHLPAFDHGLKFLDAGRKVHQGAIASPDGSFDYPTYATAFWLLIRQQLHDKADENDEAAVDWLLAAQLTEGRGFAPDSLSYGGWDLMGDTLTEGITTGSNVSVTMFVLEALQPVASPAVDDARRKARIWLTRCQAKGSQGGFAFTPEAMEHPHKAGLQPQDSTAYSYGTTTADGWRCLMMTGAKNSDAGWIGCRTWLEKRPAVEVVPGFEHLPPEIGWQRGLRFYYAQSLAAVLPQFEQPLRGQQQNALATSLLKSQRTDGSWQNDSARMREDDPLIATSFALLALSRLLAIEPGTGSE